MFDFFCKAGGAGMGYHMAGFEVIGFDIEPQPNYPFEFHQVDVLELDPDWIAATADAVHGSPPCQAFSVMSASRPGLADSYPNLIPETRALFLETKLPYIIENVPRAPLIEPVTLCGHMFGLPLYRHRLFESNFALRQLKHVDHTLPGSKAGHWLPGQIVSVSGNCAPVALARLAMGIDWTNRRELAEAIPPAYTHHLGRQLLRAL